MGSVVLWGFLADSSCGEATHNEAQAEVLNELNVDKLIVELKDKREETAEQSAMADEALGKMGAKAEPAVDDLIMALADKRHKALVADAAVNAFPTRSFREEGRFHARKMFQF